MGTKTYRLKGKTPNTFAIKQENAFGKKIVNGEGIAKQIAYYPGRNSIFTEDNEGILPTTVPDFEFNSATNQTELTVSETNKNLIMYLEAHGWNGSIFELHNADLEAEKDLVGYDGIERAMTFISSKNENEIKALSLLVFGEGSVANSTLVNKQKLMEVAVEKPSTIINLTEEIDFESLYLGAMAFVLRIVENNNTMTAVRWVDNGGVIIRVATGESPVQKLGEYLTTNSDESNTTLQELSNRMDAIRKTKTVQKNSNVSSDADSNRIAELEAKIAELSATKNVVNTPVENNVSEQEIIEVNTSVLPDDLESLRLLYFQKFGKEVAPVKKNDAAWIKDKLNE